MIDIEEIDIKKLNRKEEKIPYDLLLLADPSRRMLEKYIHDSDIFTARFKKKLIAVYVLLQLDPVTIEIKNIAVGHDYQNQGIGKFLLKYAIEKIKRRGFQYVIIATGNSSIGQLYLYQRMGFEMMEVKHNHFVDNYDSINIENEIECKHQVVLRKTL